VPCLWVRVMSKEDKEKSANSKQQGAVLILSMAFILIVSALAVSMAAISGTNARLASSRREAASALASAASGLEVSRYWLSRVVMPSSTPPSAYFTTIVNTLQDNLAGSSISNIALSQTGFISSAQAHSPASQCFSGQILVNPANPSILQVYSTGGGGRVTRTVGVCFDVKPYKHPIFNFGIATRGPLNCAGNLTVRGANSAWEADVYIESPNNLTPAIDNHVVPAVDPIEFPVPDTGRFRRYATGRTIDSSSDLSRDMVLTNATIAAGMNPHFAGRLTIEGILFIESPNVVTFDQDVALHGLIVAGSGPDDPGTNKIDFCGGFSSGPYPDRAEFDAIRSEAGSSILAPGFAVSFQGKFSTLEGVVAVSSIRFCGNVNAVIKGTIINYSQSPLNIEANAVMNFDRQASARVPAGFDSLRVLTCNPSSYEELAI